MFHPRPIWRSLAAVGVLLFFVILIARIMATSTQSARAEQARVDLPAAPPLPAVEHADEPGLALTIESLAKGASATGVHDTRATRLLALYVPAGAAPSALTPAGPLRATFEGELTMRLRDFIDFHAEGRGKLTLKLNDKVVLEAAGDDLSATKSDEVRLNKGKNHLVAIYESTTGDAALRMFWAPKGLAAEPLPPAILSHDAAEPAVQEGTRVREGRFLVAQYRCTRCHRVPGVDEKAGMPELSQDAPSLADIGARLNPDWLVAWINNPAVMRSKVHMPRIFRNAADDKEIDPRAREVAAYLATLGKSSPAADAPGDELVEAGGKTFASLNCIACHITPDRAAPGAPEQDEGRISLAHVAAKFGPGALTQFLLKPEAHYAWIPMPNFRLSDSEASGLAAYLSKTSTLEIAAGPKGNADNGLKLLRSSGCLNCHAMDAKPVGQESTLAAAAFDAIPKEGWSRGCLAAAEAERNTAPDFGLTDTQREAILAFAATDRSSLTRDNAAEFAERQIANLRCAACHGRDGKESLLATTLDGENQELKGRHPSKEQPGTEGIAPDQRGPILTWAGEKLRPEWMQSFIGGEIAYKPRYYLLARMPGFASRSKGLAAGLTQEHGCSPTLPPYPPANAELAAIGRKLAGKIPNEGFSCVQCHAISAQPPLAPFEAPAINFMYVSERIREDYYYRWLHNPLRVDPESKMPRFADEEGKSGIGAVFDGDAKRQYEALWNYVRLGKEITPPVGP